jgi:hypothetical protein
MMIDLKRKEKKKLLFKAKNTISKQQQTKIGGEG